MIAFGVGTLEIGGSGGIVDFDEHAAGKQAGGYLDQLLAGFAGGFFGVDHQVQKHLLQLSGRSHDGGLLDRKLGLNLDSFGLAFGLAELEQAGEERDEIHGFQVGLLDLGERIEPGDDLRGAAGFARDHL